MLRFLTGIRVGLRLDCHFSLLARNLDDLENGGVRLVENLRVVAVEALRGWVALRQCWQLSAACLVTTGHHERLWHLHLLVMHSGRVLDLLMLIPHLHHLAVGLLLRLILPRRLLHGVHHIPDLVQELLLHDSISASL